MRRRRTISVFAVCAAAVALQAVNPESAAATWRQRLELPWPSKVGVFTPTAIAAPARHAWMEVRRAQRRGRQTYRAVTVRLLAAAVPARISAKVFARRAHARKRALRARSASSASRHVYCVGKAGYGAGGWQWDGTSAGWIRQYPHKLPNRVSFDSSVQVMQSVGCETVRAELRPDDRDPNGGTTHQRAQLYVSDDQLAKYGRQPPLGDERGQTTWYGFAFATNPGYRPQTGLPSGAWANWNLIFSWHDTPLAGVWAQANIQLVVATSAPATGSTAVACGAPYAPLSKPRLSVELNGGNQDDPKWYIDDADNTCRRYFGPMFVPGHVYRIAMAVTWGDHKSGAVRLWIDGTEVVNATSIDTMWYGAAGQAHVFPVFENYRPYSPNIGTPNSVFYGGLVKGSSYDDVRIP